MHNLHNLYCIRTFLLVRMRREILTHLSLNFLQVINNACATQAIISVLLNVSHSDMDLGSVLTEFKEFSGPLDPAVSHYPAWHCVAKRSG